MEMLEVAVAGPKWVMVDSRDQQSFMLEVAEDAMVLWEEV